VLDQKRTRGNSTNRLELARRTHRVIQTEKPRTGERTQVGSPPGRRLNGPYSERRLTGERGSGSLGAFEIGDQLVKGIVRHRRPAYRFDSSGHYYGVMSLADTNPLQLPSAQVLSDQLAGVLEPVPTTPPAHVGRLAAVLILLYDRNDAPHMVLTKRTDTLEHHPGQISLPGGRWESVDGALGTTALRETHEELGIPPESVELVGRLHDELTAVSGFVVAPFVGWARGPVEPVPSEREIARVLHIPLTDVLEADAALPTSLNVTTLRYPLLGEDVWGATARILHLFSALVRRALGETVG
jgi:8-oxo-dGTP pyrophosphatase MutT (NUDIX family)